MGINVLTIMTLLVLAYIMQVLIMLVWPYYEYRKSCNNSKGRTIGGLMDFTEDIFGYTYRNLTFLPFIGLLIAIFILIIRLIFIGLEYLYDKFIKGIKI